MQFTNINVIKSLTEIIVEMAVYEAILNKHIDLISRYTNLEKLIPELKKNNVISEELWNRYNSIVSIFKNQ
jgi:hypothetical protein